MNKLMIVTLAIFSYVNGFGQDSTASIKVSLLKELAESSCKCIDSISTDNKSTKEIAEKVNACIAKSTGAYQMSAKLFASSVLSKDSLEKV